MKLNYVLRTLLYCSVILILSAYYDGWSSTTQYFINENVYVGGCTVDEISKNTTPGVFKCESQGYMIGRLLTYYRVSEFVSSVFWGIFMDKYGPKITIILGIILRILSWMLMVIHTNFSDIMIICAILAGMSCNAIVFPMYTLAQYNKDNYYISMCLISVALSIATFYMFIFNLVREYLSNVSMVTLVYLKLLLTHVPMLILTAFIVPMDLTLDLQLNGGKKEEKGDVENCRSTFKREVKKEVKGSVGCNGQDGKNECNELKVLSSSSSSSSSPTPSTPSSSSSTSSPSTSPQSSSPPSGSTGVSCVLKDKDQWKFGEFISICIKYDVIILEFAAIVNFVSFTFAQESFPLIFSGNSKAILINSILIPLSFIFSLIFMVILKYIKVITIIIFINIFSVMAHLNIFSNHFCVSVIISLTMSIGYSLLVTQYYMYLDKTVPITYSGSVKGYFTTIIGFTILLNLIINKLVETYNCERLIHIILVILRFSITIPLIILYLQQENKCNENNNDNM